MSHILIVGQKFSSLTDYLLEHGHTYTLLQDVLKTKFPDKKFKNRIVADFSSKQTLLTQVDSIKHTIDGVMTTYENYVLPTAWIAEHLNLPGLPVATAEACTDKFLMRSLFNQAPEKISPTFATVSTEDDVRQFARTHSFPLILKPANLAKSLLVTKSSTLEELLNNYAHSVKLLQTIYKKYAPNRTPKLIIEEFLEGSIHSVDAFVDNKGKAHILKQVVDYQTGYDIGYNDNFHYSRVLPSTLSNEDTESLRHCAAVGIRALGMKNSAAHVEIIMTQEGPRIVEIGARNGGYRERMHAIANDIDITGAALSITLGQQPSITSTKNDPVAVLELFPKTPGIFTGIEHLDSLKALSGINYLRIKANKDTYIGKSSDGFKMTAVIILSLPESQKEIFYSQLQYITKNIHVTTLPTSTQ